jgi:hypothetical protein
VARDQLQLVATSDERIGEVANQPLATTAALRPEDVADERDPQAGEPTAALSSRS